MKTLIPQLMIYDGHPELQNKWNKAFWARGYYVATVGNLTEEAIRSTLQSSRKNQEKKIVKEPLFSGSQ